MQLSGALALGSAPRMPKLSDIRLDAGPATCIIHDESVRTTVPPAQLHVVARVDGLYRLNDTSAVAGASDLEPTPWLYRESGLNLNPFPVPGQAEMVQYQATLAAGRYAFRLGGTIYDFLVDGTPADPNLCVDRYAIAMPNTPAPAVQYRLCNDRLISPVLDLFMRGVSCANKALHARRRSNSMRRRRSMPRVSAGARHARLRSACSPVESDDGGVAERSPRRIIVIRRRGRTLGEPVRRSGRSTGCRGLAYVSRRDLVRAAADTGDRSAANRERVRLRAARAHLLKAR